MGTNWFPGNNPESIPRFGYIPRITLPTVFGDALTYMEQIARYNAEFNKAIDGINKLAEDIETEVQNSVENAKIPVYGELVNNGSVIISPNNWNVDNPKALYEAMAAGKLCILHGNLSFNIDGLPVVQATNNMYFILTQFYQTVVNNNSTNVYTVFVNYDETHVRIVKMNLYKEGDVYTSEINDMREIHLPTDIEFEQIDNLFKKCVFVYKGHERIPDEEGQYIELRENATEADLSSFFVVQRGGSMYVPDCAPAVCVDAENGNIGQLRYGGNTTPWARVYSYGIRLCGQYVADIATLDDEIDELRDDIHDNSVAIDGVNGRVDGVVDDLNSLSDNVDTMDGENVKYVAQTRSAADKARARSNIGAAPTENPVFIGELALGNGYGASVMFNVTSQGGVVALDFSQSPIIIAGVRDPINAQDVATKRYVDGVAEAIDSVKYSAQDRTDNERRIARENIGAVSVNNPYVYGTFSVENSNIVLELTIAPVSGNKVLTLGGTSGTTVVRNVGAPVEDSDAATKAYVDSVLVLSEGNVKFNVYQNLNADQRARARANISAIGKNEDLIATTEFLTTEELEYVPQIALKSELIDENLDPYYRKLFIGWSPNQNDGAVTFVDDDGEYHPLRAGRGVSGNDCVTMSQLNDTKAPFIIVINSAENAWTTNNPVPAWNNLTNIINAYATSGLNLLISYKTVGIAGVAYATPKCAGLDIGIVCEGVSNGTWKRYTINADGTVTTVTL